MLGTGISSVFRVESGVLAEPNEVWWFLLSTTLTREQSRASLLAQYLRRKFVMWEKAGRQLKG